MRFLKEYVIIAIILIIIILIEIITNRTLNNTIDWMNNKITSIENKIKENREQQAKNEFDNLKNEWKEKDDKLSIFIEHNELEKISKNIIVIESNLKNDDKEKCLENIAEIKFILEHIREKNQMKLKNLF